MAKILIAEDENLNFLFLKEVLKKNEPVFDKCPCNIGWALQTIKKWILVKACVGSVGPLLYNECPSRNGRAPISALANLVEIKAREKFNRRHMVDIPRIKFFAQR